jgi:glycosyltransferase involved in cell wall biosynthesis
MTAPNPPGLRRPRIGFADAGLPLAEGALALSKPQRPLNIVHVFRAPLGGLFRHVVDLTRGQSARGHRVGLVCDSLTGGDRADEAIAALSPYLALGAFRTPMPRHASWRDLSALWHVSRRVKECEADVVHGHGAKGGAYARFAFAPRGAIRVYTPHGGSLNYDHTTAAGQLYLAVEKILMGRGDVYTFESAYSENVYRAKVGQPRSLVRVIYNGVSPAEFEPLQDVPDSTDLVFLGEFRPAKGIDTLFESLILLLRKGRRVTITLVGDGPDMSAMRAQIERDGLHESIRIFKPMAARAALALGRVMVVPSRAESLPYVVLEAAAARKPLIVTNVGGIPEIYGPLSDELVPPRDAPALAAAIERKLADCTVALATARALQDRVRNGFSLDSMVDGVLNAYEDGLTRKATG